MKTVYATNVAKMVIHEPYHITLLALRLGAKSLRYCRRIAILTKKLSGQYMTCAVFAHCDCEPVSSQLRMESTYIELMKQLIKSDLPLMNTCSPIYHVVSHYDLDHN